MTRPAQTCVARRSERFVTMEEKKNQNKANIMKKLLKNKFLWIGVAAVLVVILAIIFWPKGTPQQQTSVASAQEIMKMLKVENVTIENMTMTDTNYEITYAAESAVGRFDDAMLYDWATIYAVTANYKCETVSIITTLDGQPMERQTASCESVRALARGVLTENEFWMLVKHESLVKQ